jgi:hypothetical protein
MPIQQAQARFSGSGGVIARTRGTWLIGAVYLAFGSLRVGGSQRQLAQTGATLRAEGILSAKTSFNKWYTQHTFAGEGKLIAFWGIPGKFEREFPRYVLEIPPRVTLKRQIEQMEDIMTRVAAGLLAFSAPKGRPASILRRRLGDLLAFFDRYVGDRTLPQRLLDAYHAAVDAGITLAALDRVILQLYDEDPLEGAPTIFTHVNILFALAQEAHVLRLRTTFTSQQDVQIGMAKMKGQFDTAKELTADEDDSSTYRALVDLAAKVTRYLVDIGRPLPRVVPYDLGPQPALSLAYRIYSDSARWDELVKENKVVHPAFVFSPIRALSA